MVVDEPTMSDAEMEWVANIAFAAGAHFNAVAVQLRQLLDNGWSAVDVYDYVLRNGYMPRAREDKDGGNHG